MYNILLVVIVGFSAVFSSFSAWGISESSPRTFGELDPFEASLHRLAGISLVEHTISLEDCSTWEIRELDSADLTDWSIGDSIALVANRGSSGIEVYNYKNGKSVFANLIAYLPPHLHNSTNYRIVAVELKNNRVLLKMTDPFNHTVSKWSYSFLDNPEDWQIGDTVIFGFTHEQNGWMQTTFPYVLINARNQRVMSVYWDLP